MQDMLVKLYDLPDITSLIKQLHERENIIFRREIAPEKTIVCRWVNEHFSQYWKDECEVSFTNSPVSCFIAQIDNEIIGFSCYEATCKNFFGPTGILPSYRNKGIGKVLLILALQAMQELGYSYAIIGGVGPISFYKNAVNAIPIPESASGVYKDMLKLK